MMKKYINIKNSMVILFLIHIMWNIYNAEIAKSTYRHDVDYQVSRFQEYNVKPIQIKKKDRLGGYYSVYLYYGDISDKELDSVIIFKSRREKWLDKEFWGRKDDATSFIL